MKLVNRQLSTEQERLKKALAGVDTRSGDCVIGINDVIDAHFCLLDFLFEAGPSMNTDRVAGAIDQDRLVSAVTRQNRISSTSHNENVAYRKCAALFYSLVKDCPFERFNSSTALLSMLYYLSKMSRVPKAHPKELEVITRIIASKEIRQRDAFEPYSAFEDGEIVFLAHYLEENTRPAKAKDFIFTYSALHALMDASGLALMNPHFQSIDVVRKKKSTASIKPLTNKENYISIGEIGFTGWTEKVPESELRHLQSLASRIPGSDFWCQEVAFQSGPQLPSLITTYLSVFRRIVEDDEKRSQEREIDTRKTLAGHR